MHLRVSYVSVLLCCLIFFLVQCTITVWVWCQILCALLPFVVFWGCSKVCCRCSEALLDLRRIIFCLKRSLLWIIKWSLFLCFAFPKLRRQARLAISYRWASFHLISKISGRRACECASWHSFRNWFRRHKRISHNFVQSWPFWRIEH